jgi:hypothetical protein
MVMSPDFDQSGTFRQWVRQYLGPSVGTVLVPQQIVQTITTGGSFTLDPSTNLVQVNSSGAVTITLPAASTPAAGVQAQPQLFAKVAIRIVDVGGNAAANPITIQPAAGDTILGLASIQITSNYGGFQLTPNPTARTWNSI